MYNNLIVLLLSAFLLFSCSDNKKKIAATDFQTNSFSIPIGNKSINIHGTYSIVRQDKNEYLFLYDFIMNRISKINFTEKKFEKNILIQTGKYTHNGASDLWVIDSTFITRNLNTYSFINNNGSIVKQVDIRKLIDNLDAQDLPLLTQTLTSPDYDSNGMVYQILSSHRVTDKNFFDHLYLAEINLMNEKVRINKIKNPVKSIKNNLETFGYRSNPFLTETKRKLILQFSFSPDLFLYNKSTLRFERQVKIGARFIDFPHNQPILIDEFLNKKDKIFIKELESQNYYNAIIYNQYRDEFYLVVRIPPNLDEKKEKDFSLEIIILDDNLNPKNKLILEEKYGPFLYISRNGIFIRKKEQQESFIELDQLLF